MIVVADSSPLRYLILIEQANLLPVLYGSILLPPEVVGELTRNETPHAVRNWIETLPAWVDVRTPQSSLSELAPALGRGEREAIALAQEVFADALLVDDEAARREAYRRNIPVQGTLAVLDLAASHGLVSFTAALQRLMATNFRASPRVIQFFLQRDAERSRR